jgi:hypothetical protein
MDADAMLIDFLTPAAARDFRITSSFHQWSVVHVDLLFYIYTKLTSIPTEPTSQASTPARGSAPHA